MTLSTSPSTPVRWFAPLLVTLLLAPAAFAQPYLILHDFYYVAGRDGHSGTVATPAFVRDNREYLESTPFDGLALYIANDSRSVNPSRYTFSSKRVSYTSIRDLLAPVRGLQFNTLKHNFAFVTIDRPNDWFDDWTTPIQNFRDLARAAKEAGLKGIFLDNEQYYGKLFNYPDSVDYPERSLSEYRTQARLRGRQIMQAMVAEFPEIEILVFHGPYVSSPNAPFWTPEPDSHPLFQRLDAYYELLGPFFVGLVEGAGSQATVIDGGELKHFRPEIDYKLGYQFRKHDIASSLIDSDFIPTALRPDWPEKVNLAYTLFDKPIRGEDMNPTIARETLVHALRYTDKYVWVYTEEHKFLLAPSHPDGAPLAWHNAIRGAKEEVVGSGGSPSPSGNSSVQPSSGTGAKQQFTFVFKTGNGSPVTGASILINDGFAKTNSCWISYDSASNLIFLADDDLVPWYSAQFGTTGEIRNSQCLVLLGGSSVTKSGGQLTLEFSLWFLDRGPKDVYLSTNGSGYVLTSTWNVP